MENFYYTGYESRSKLLKKYGFKEEEKETMKEQYYKTGFPKPFKFYQLTMEAYDLSLEEPYFWVLDQFKENFHIIEKLEDSFAASENSAFFGVTQQRLGAQQDKVSQFLATTGKMIKELFQMVRELRILDERLGYYEESAAEIKKSSIGARSKSAEITLKGIFIDLVQGGAKNAASVFGMSRELEFVTLPDLFFDAPPFANTNELDTHISGLEKDFNQNVLRVLQRHLKQYMEWKKRTHDEHQNRKTFMLKYLDQHFQIIKMYVQWVKPYLRNVAKLSLNEKNMSAPDLITSFEGSLIDIEVLARKRTPVGKSGANACILATFTYRTRPEMKVVQEGYQRGPVHIGKFEMNFRLYSWTDKQVQNYHALKNEETFAIMGDISDSVKSAMDSLGDQLYKYLDEAKGVAKKEEDKEETIEKKTFTEKFFGDFYTPKKKPSVKAVSDEQVAKDHAKAETKCKSKGVWGHVQFHGYNIYKNFKKAHRMVQW